MRETLTAGLQKPAAFIRSARSVPNARRSVPAMPGDGAKLRKPASARPRPTTTMCSVSGTVVVWPFWVTTILTTIRKAAVRGASRGNAILPWLTTVIFVPGPATSRWKNWARQRASAGLTVRDHADAASFAVA